MYYQNDMKTKSKKIKLKTVNLSEATHYKVIAHCEKIGMLIYAWIDKALLRKIQEEENQSEKE